MAENKRFGLKTKIGCGLILLFALTIGGCWGASSFVYSDSFREGTLQKFGSKGIAYKTYEGELAQAGFGGSQTGKTGQTGGNTWSFSVADEDVATTLKDAPIRQSMRCHYKEHLIAWPYATKYRVWKVEFITAPPVTNPKIPEATQ